MHGLAFLMLFLTMLFSVAVVVFWVWTLIDCVTNKRLTDTQKIIWALVIIFVGVIGSLIYFLAGRSPKAYAPPQQYYYVQQTYGSPMTEQAPAENYRPYQEGYRAQEQESPQPLQTSEAGPASDEQPAQQVQYEQMQISYPE